MNVLSINKFYWRKGGSETVFFNEKELLEGHGHAVVPFSMKGEGNLPSEYERFFVDYVDYGVGGLKGKLQAAGKVIFSLEARRNMDALLMSFEPDLAHFHIFQHQISPSVFGPLKKRGIPLVLTLHDLKPICPNYKMYVNGRVCEQCKGGKFVNCLKNRCTKGSTLQSFVNMVEMYLHTALGYYQGVQKYIAVSQFYRAKMIEFGFAEEQVAYIPNYIDLGSYEAGTDDKGYVLFFGRLSEEKGVDTLIEAAVSLADMPIRIVGTGPAEDQLKELVAAKGAKNVSFQGFKTGDELRGIVRNCSFTVVPSVWYENCPMSVLESLAYAKPVLGADIGGIPELIDQGSDGAVFKAGDARDLVRGMREMWEAGPERRAEMGQRGRVKMANRFNAEEHYAALMRVYDEVTASHVR